ncbi:Uncharacterised protein [Delftia tsuruhatensis]|nr:Uncharacterised protein [Delftia tsuruhatensis]
MHQSAQQAFDQATEATFTQAVAQAGDQLVQRADHGLQCLAVHLGQAVDQLGQHAQGAAIHAGQAFQQAGDHGCGAVGGIGQCIQQLAHGGGHGAAQQAVDHVLHGGHDAVATAGARAAARHQSAQQAFDQATEAAFTQAVAQAGDQLVQRADHGLQALSVDLGEAVDQFGQHAQGTPVDRGQILECASDGRQQSVGGIGQGIDQLADRLRHGAAEQAIHDVLDGCDHAGVRRSGGIARAAAHQATEQAAHAGEQPAQCPAFIQQASQHVVHDAADGATGTHLVQALEQLVERADQGLQTLVLDIDKAIHQFGEYAQRPSVGAGQVFQQAGHCRQRAVARVHQRIDQIAHGTCHRAAGQSSHHVLHRGDQAMTIRGIRGIGRLRRVGRVGRVRGFRGVGRVRGIGRVRGFRGVGRVRGIGRIGRIGRVRGFRRVGRVRGIGRIGRIRRIRRIRGVGRVRRMGGVRGVGRIRGIGRAWRCRVIVVVGRGDQGDPASPDQAGQQEVAEHGAAGLRTFLGDDQADGIAVIGGCDLDIARTQVQHHGAGSVAFTALGQRGLRAALESAHQGLAILALEQRLGAAIGGHDDLVAYLQRAAGLSHQRLPVAHDLHARADLRQRGGDGRLRQGRRRLHVRRGHLRDHDTGGLLLGELSGAGGGVASGLHRLGGHLLSPEKG